MTQIKVTFPDAQNLAKVLERFREVAAARGVVYEEALRQALLAWVDNDPTVEHVTEQEWSELAPVLERIRQRNAHPEGSSAPKPAQ